MSLKLDDLLVKKKEPVQILDLSKSTANTKEELKKLLEKVPEFKIKTDKVKSEDIKINDKKFSFLTPKKELKKQPFPFMNPVPTEMKSLCLNDLCSISIQWKMLTSLRPKNKLDEEYYSRLVELGKLQFIAREKEKEVPLLSYWRKSKNKAGVLETKIVSCRNCGEEFCSSETCCQFAYDLYERETVAKLNELTDSANVGNEPYEENGQKMKKSSKSKKRMRKKVTKKVRKTVFLKTTNTSKSTKMGGKNEKNLVEIRMSQQATLRNNKIRKSPSKAEVKKIKQKYRSISLQSPKDSPKRPRLPVVVTRARYVRKSKIKRKK